MFRWKILELLIIIIITIAGRLQVDFCLGAIMHTLEQNYNKS